MARIGLGEDPHRFIQYYESQVGGNLPGFYGAPVMYGRGIGSLFSRLFRFISPLVKKGFAIAKPHLKSAATGIASDVFSKAVGQLTSQQKQEGSGGIMVMSRRTRPPGQRASSASHKASNLKRKKSVGRGTRKKRKSTVRGDIF